MAAESVIVALSEGVRYDGTLLPNTYDVVKAAVVLFESGVAKTLVLSSGKSFKFHDRIKHPESFYMRDAAVAMGVDKKHMLLETHSVDTPTNAYFSKLLIRKKLGAVKNVIVVTSDTHKNRSVFLFKVIFGPDYRIIPMVFRDNERDKKNLEIAKKCEKISLDLFKTYLKEYDISPGEDFKFRLILRDKYRDKPKFTRLQANMFKRLIDLRKSHIRLE